jgi:hypothetical protein
MKKLGNFLHGREVIKKLRRAVANGRTSFVINFEDLLRHDLGLAHDLVYDPDRFLSAADEILRDLTKLPDIHLRVRGLDRTYKPNELRARDIDHFVQIEGTVTSVTEPRFVKEGDAFEDYQHARVDGLEVELWGDLVGMVRLPDRVRATGTLLAIPTQTAGTFRPFLRANHVEVIRP